MNCDVKALFFALMNDGRDDVWGGGGGGGLEKLTWMERSS